MLAFFKKFCNEIVSRTWKLKRGKNARYEDQDFLKVFFYSVSPFSYLIRYNKGHQRDKGQHTVIKGVVSHFT